MDRRDRKYYLVSFYGSYTYRRRIIKICCPSIKMHENKIKNEPQYEQMYSVKNEEADELEYELRKAERRDGWCLWKEV